MERRQGTRHLWIVLLIIGLITLVLTSLLAFFAFGAANSIAAMGTVGLTVGAATVAILTVGILSYSRSNRAGEWRLFGRQGSRFRK
jgi:branched-subunit amino acid transport protein AzlD